MRRSSFSAVVLGLFIVSCTSAAENTADIGAQMQLMQKQLNDMAQKLESQQKKIDEQDRTIREFKVAARSNAMATAPGVDAVRDENFYRDREPKKDESKPNPEHMRSYDLPPITVTGEAENTGGLREENRVGAYGQPRWSARRRFTETRAYVIPKGEFEFEYWSVIETPRKGKPQIETKYETEIGLPNHLQLDLYAISHEDANVRGKGKFGFDEQDAELRWALADWNKIPGNPTLYAEYKFLDGQADHLEFKTLFAGEAAPRVHWAANAVWEHAMGGDQTNTYELTGGVSYTVMDEKFSAGGEVKLGFDDTKKRRGLHNPNECFVGPSFQLSPLKQMHIDISPLIGITRQSAAFKSLLIVGWEF